VGKVAARSHLVFRIHSRQFLALPPDIPDAPDAAFLREVDDNLRKEQFETFAKRYGTWLVAALIIFLVAVGGYLYWQQKQQQKSQVESEELTAIYTEIGNGRLDAAKKRLQPLEESSNDIVRAAASLAQAAIALNGNDRQSALAKFHAVAEDSGLPKPYRDAALVRATTLEFDSLKPQDVVARMEPLAQAGNPWFGSAGELTAMAYLKMGQKDKAGRLFASVATDRTVPDTIRNRAQQIAGTLGVDATAATPPASQPGTQ
jgi:hypothetical protein